MEFKNSSCNIENLIIKIFSVGDYLNKFFSAREKILNQANEGKRDYFLFSYPNLGQYYFDHNIIQKIYELADKKSLDYLYSGFSNTKYHSKYRLQYLASLLVKCSLPIINLLEDLKKSKKFVDEKRLLYVYFKNPFQKIFPTVQPSAKFTAEEILLLNKISQKYKFNGFFQLN